MFVKINGTLVKKQKYLLQISVIELHNEMVLPSYDRDFSGAITVDKNICIGDISLRKYMPQLKKIMSNRNKITYGCETCISAMLLQSVLNKRRISKLAKLDKLYINPASTRLLEISKNDFIEYKKQIFPNDLYINLRYSDAALSYNCSSPITVSKIPKWKCILK